jgi:hypothetical protein
MPFWQCVNKFSLLCYKFGVEQKEFEFFCPQEFPAIRSRPSQPLSGSRASTDRFRRKFIGKRKGKNAPLSTHEQHIHTHTHSKKQNDGVQKNTQSAKNAEGGCIVSVLHPFLIFQRQRGASSTRSAGCELIEARSGNELGSCCEAAAHRCWQPSTTALGNRCESTQQGDSKCTNDHRHPNLCRKYQTR